MCTIRSSVPCVPGTTRALPSFHTFRMAMNVVARVITWFPFPGFVATKAMSSFQWHYLIQPYVFSIALMVPCFIDRNRTTVGYFDHITRLIGSPQNCSRWFLMAWTTKQTNNAQDGCKSKRQVQQR